MDEASGQRRLVIAGGHALPTRPEPPVTLDHAPTLSDARDVLRSCFGYESFRPGQEDVIGALLEGRDALAVMPTGAGKSVCYQVPAALWGAHGLTLVVSPLISLMQDQVQALKQVGIRGSYLNSTLTPGQQRVVLQRAREGWYDLMYVAPERLADPWFRAFAAQVELPLLAVDEAHCVSQWGQDFRPAYRQIRDFVESLPARPPVAALTATATRRVRDDVVELLGLRQPQLQVNGFDRPNLRLSSFEMRPRDKKKWLVAYVRAHVREAGIVYCPSRKLVEELRDLLQKEGFSAVGYHAGMGDDERAWAQAQFVNDDALVMVATNAFGMGIDKSNVRYVINCGLPLSLEEYYQEAGRAGRDGEPSDCILLWSAGDMRTGYYLLEHSSAAEGASPEDQAALDRSRRSLFGTMIGYARSETCLRGRILSYFGQRKAVDDTCSGCSVCEPRDPWEGLKAPRTTRRGGSTATYASRPVANPWDESADLSAWDADDAWPSDGSQERKRRARGDVHGARDDGSAQGLRGDFTVSLAEGENQELFERLRELRKALAREQGVAPYVVFHDSTLRAMVQLRPQTEEEFLEVPGVGKAKLARYGEAFLAELAQA